MLLRWMKKIVHPNDAKNKFLALFSKSMVDTSRCLMILRSAFLVLEPPKMAISETKYFVNG